MSRKSYQPEAVIDTFGHGFRVPLFGSRGPMLRNLAIVGVSFDGDLEDAQFFNPAGLVVPCRAGDGLRRLLTRASHREYSKIVGHGQFAKPEHVLKSMEGAGTQRKWMTCYFERSEFCFYFDDAAAWAAHEQAEIADLTPTHFLEMAELERRLQSRQRLASEIADGPQGLPDLPTPAELEERRQKAIAERLADLQEQRRQALEQDRQLGAWLRGELPAPPLLRSVA
ncbi:hypothetical protein [Geopseudomonas aromaticivorans]